MGASFHKPWLWAKPAQGIKTDNKLSKTIVNSLHICWDFHTLCQKSTGIGIALPHRRAAGWEASCRNITDYHYDQKNH